MVVAPGRIDAWPTWHHVHVILSRHRVRGFRQCDGVLMGCKWRRWTKAGGAAAARLDPVQCRNRVVDARVVLQTHDPHDSSRSWILAWPLH